MSDRDHSNIQNYNSMFSAELIIQNFIKNNPIKYISYSIIVNNKTKFRLYSCDKWLNFYAENKLYTKCPLASSAFKSTSNNIIQWNNLYCRDKEKSEILQSRRLYNQNYGVTIIVNNKSFTEAFVLSSQCEINYYNIMAKDPIKNLFEDIRLCTRHLR